MKGFKKLLTGILAASMIMGSSITAFAQDVTLNNTDNATITISNAAMGETYKIYKLFDATVTGTPNGSIAYTGEVPASLSAFFTKDGVGNITATEAAGKDTLTKEAAAALKAWAQTQNPTAEAVSDGTTLNFKGLEYGYYVVFTSQGDQAITVNSTNPNATLVDKNSTTPTLIGKSVDDSIVNIGQTVNYTVEFSTANYSGSGENAKQIVEYIITDTLPDFLDDVVVTSVVIDEDAKLNTTEDQYKLENPVPQFNEKKVSIPWVDSATKTSLYKNGAHVYVSYSAVVTEKAAIAGAGNTNKVTLSWVDTEGNETPGQGEKTATIYTYAIAVKKVSQTGANLSGATFRFPFALKKNEDGTFYRLSDGSYVYDGKGEAEIATPDDGTIVVRGLVSDAQVAITETVAPDGYNKLSGEIDVTPVATSETKTLKTWKLDENGDVIIGSEKEATYTVNYSNEVIAATAFIVVNKTGSMLPSTGGMGTTLFYIIGAVLVIAGVAYFMVRRKADAQ